MGIFDTLFGGGAEKEAAAKNRALYNEYQTKGSGYLDTGFAGSKDALATAKGEYAPLSSLFNKGSGLYADALGVNGPEGNTRATSAFQAGPGYHFTLDQGLDALNRRRATGGMLNSGNADIDALKFGTGLANQEYGNWLSNLSGYDNKALTTAGAMSGVDMSLANLYQNDATNRIGLQGNTTSGLTSANNLEAAGKAAGAKNLLGAGLGLASLVAGGGGGLGGLGSSLGGLTSQMKLGNLFMGGGSPSGY